jgi:hypothetical protein
MQADAARVFERLIVPVFYRPLKRRQRLPLSAGPGEVLSSRTVRDAIVGSAVGFESPGVHVLKGVPGEWEIDVALR